MGSLRLPTVYTPTEVETLLATARKRAEEARTPAKCFATWRDVVMVQTGLYAGLRVSELTHLRIDDIDLAAPELMVRQGKGRKDRVVPIAAKLLTALTEWIGDRKDGYVFPGPRGRRFSVGQFEARLHALAKAAGVKKTVRPHGLRHTFATSLLKKGVDLRTIQKAMGHASIATTQIYTHLETSDIKKGLDLL